MVNGIIHGCYSERKDPITGLLRAEWSAKKQERKPASMTSRRMVRSPPQCISDWVDKSVGAVAMMAARAP